MVAAVVRVLSPHVDHCGTTTHTALHAAPPEITGRISMVCASSSMASPGTSSSPWITNTDSRLRSRRLSNAITLIGPATSISRRGLRSRTFTVERLGVLDCVPEVGDHHGLAWLQLEALDDGPWLHHLV